jgi:hypothetical protein
VVLIGAVIGGGLWPAPPTDDAGPSWLPVWVAGGSISEMDNRGREHRCLDQVFFPHLGYIGTINKLR